MSLETVRISQRGKEQLIKLKRITGIAQWNTLCRWALATSLADPTVPLVRDVKGDSNVEMTWKTFGGQWADIYLAHVRMRAFQDHGHDDPAAVERTFMAHLHRGIGYLAGNPDLGGIADLIALASTNAVGEDTPNQGFPRDGSALDLTDQPVSA